MSSTTALLQSAQKNLLIQCDKADSYFSFLHQLRAINPCPARADFEVYTINLFVDQMAQGNHLAFLNHDADFTRACLWAVDALQRRGVKVRFPRVTNPPKPQDLYLKMEANLKALDPRQAIAAGVDIAALPAMHPDIQRKLVADGDIDIIHDDAYSSLIALRTVKACRTMALNTKYCTVKPQHAARYLQYGAPLYLMQDKTTDEIYQLSLTPWELRNEDNIHVLPSQPEPYKLQRTMQGIDMHIMATDHINTGLARNWPLYREYLKHRTRQTLRMNRNDMPRALMAATSLLALGDTPDQAGYRTIEQAFRSAIRMKTMELIHLMDFGLPAILQLQGDPRQGEIFKHARLLRTYTNGTENRVLANRFADNFSSILPDIDDLALQYDGITTLMDMRKVDKAAKFLLENPEFVASVMQTYHITKHDYPVRAKVRKSEHTIPPMTTHIPTRLPASPSLASLTPKPV